MLSHTVPNTATALEGCRIAAERLGVTKDDAYSHFVAGGEWDAATADELADLIVESWEEMARSAASAAGRHQ